MTEPVTPPTSPALQFDRAVTAGSPPTADSAGVACSQCYRLITGSYFNLDQRPFCGSCKTKIVSGYRATLTPRVFAKAFGFGLAAAIAGAVVYYAVIAITNLEIGIVAILIGYMVGYAIRKATRGYGARRYQILAAALTYFAVGLAYMPLAFKGSTENGAASADSTRVAASDTTMAATTDSVVSSVAKVSPATDSANASPTSSTSFIKAVAALVFMVFALPVMVIVGSMPSGLLSALIIGFGIRHAWRMTAPPDLVFQGPLKVAPPPGRDAATAPA